MNMNAVLQMLSAGGNPQVLLQNLMKQNPQFVAMLNQQKQSGLSMEQFVRNYAQQNNIDLEPMLNTLRQRGMKF